MCNNTVIKINNYNFISLVTSEAFVASHAIFGVGADNRCIYFMMKVSIVVMQLNSQIVSKTFNIVRLK